MKLVTSPWTALAAALLAVVALAVALASPAPADETNDYANQTPYGNPKDAAQPVPQGYEMFFLQTVGRHGARSLTDDDTEKGVLSLWQRAALRDALTDNGQDLARDVKRFQAAEEQIGYGRLSGVGREEWQGIGQRHAETYADFFNKLDRRDEDIATITTERARTRQSAEALHEGLAKGGLELSGELLPLVEDDDLLRFSNDPSEAGEQATDAIIARDTIRGHAEDLLRGLYTEEFVDGIKNPVGAALDVFKLYATAPGMAKETDITFARYVPESTREPLSYATDAETFYQYGPGIAGETNTVDQARPLLADLFEQLDARIAGSSTAVVYRLAHGETTMPLAALIKAPGSEKQVAEGELFTRGTNPWRGAVAGRLSGNIEWSAVRKDEEPGGGAGPRAADESVLVTMRYNEKPVPFHDGCRPYTNGSYYYAVDELKSCLG